MLGGLFLLLAWCAKSGVATKYPEPEDAAVAKGVLQSDYFGLRYPLPDGWVEDLKGPEPSTTGFYSLAALKPEGELVATMQISAQDNFFAPEFVSNATDYLVEMKQHLDPSLSAPEAVASVEFGGLHFARLDYSGAGLEHSVFATAIRCHTVMFAITSQRKETIVRLTQSLKKLSFSQESQPGAATQTATSNIGWPPCVRESDYREHIVRRVTPTMVGPRFAGVPVRLTIGPDGKIEHIHAIAGFPEQVKSVTDALSQWEFTPYIADGAPVEVETGILFQFPQTKSNFVQ
jgi:hypothetical protein